MKKQLTTFAVIALAAALVVGCGSREKLASRTNEVFDMGSVPVKNGYSLHGYRLINGAFEHDHFVYVLEKDGQPVAGTTANYDVSQGKSTVNQTVTSQVAPSAMQ
jgi:hypothetical protein